MIMAASDADGLRAAEAAFRESEPQLAWNWVRSACEHAYWGQITGRDFDPSHAGLLWLRMFGVLVDLPRYLASISDASMAMQAVENVRGSLTRDELIWTQYRRDSECHIVVDAYAPLRRGKAAPNASVTAKTLPNTPSIPWAEFRAALSRALLPHIARGTNPEHALARAMAARTREPLELLGIALFNPLTQEAARLGHPFVPTPITRPRAPTR
jgi:hypothetical protein